MVRNASFNTQPPEGGWLYHAQRRVQRQQVSTHSRLKAAGFEVLRTKASVNVSTHSRLKAAGCYRCDGAGAWFVSTHSRLKAAGRGQIMSVTTLTFQHTAA